MIKWILADQQDGKIILERLKEISRPMNVDAVRERFKNGTWDNADVKWASENMGAVLRKMFGDRRT